MMWSWRDKITPSELVKHIDMLLTLTPSELKDELKTRDLPVSGTIEDLQTRLLNYDVLNMEYPQMMPQKFWNRMPLVAFNFQKSHSYFRNTRSVIGIHTTLNIELGKFPRGVVR